MENKDERIGITTYEGFKKFYERIKSTAHKVFDRDKKHSNLFFFITDEGEVISAPFDLLTELVLNNRPCPKDEAQEIVYRFYAKLIADRKCLGYVHISEAWATVPSEKSIDAAMRQWNYANEKYGGIANMPTRQEVLYIHARFLCRRYETMWRIRRIGEAVILSHKYDIDRELTPKDREFFEYSRTGLLDRTIDAVLEEKAGGKED
jgi:hypothetical protein